MLRIILAILILGASQPAPAQRDAVDLSKFPSADLVALTTEKPADRKIVALESLAAEIARGTFALQAAPADIVHQGARFRRISRQFRTVATYTGDRRQTSPALSQALEHWGGLAASREGYGTIVFRNELAFSQSGNVYWLPVHVLSLGGAWPESQPHFRAGEQYLLLGHSVGWLEDGRPMLVVLSGAAEKSSARR